MDDLTRVFWMVGVCNGRGFTVADLYVAVDDPTEFWIVPSNAYCWVCRVMAWWYGVVCDVFAHLCDFV